MTEGNIRKFGTNGKRRNGKERNAKKINAEYQNEKANDMTARNNTAPNVHERIAKVSDSKDRKRQNRMYDTVNTKNSASEGRMNDKAKDESVNGLNKNAKVGQEYAVGGLIHIVGTGANVRYVVQWYGYTAADDIFEVPTSIPLRIITRYWHWVQVKGA